MMKKSLSIAVALTVAWAGAASAHGPSRQKLTETIEINAAPAAVWEVVKEFGKPEAWMPAVASTTSQGGTAPGATRELTLKKGGVLKEELKTYEAEKMSFSYKMENPDCGILPVNNYSSNISVEAAGSGSKVTWNGAYYRCFLANNPPPDQNEEAANKAIEAVYKESLANLKAVIEKK
ncbi:SRPBCC family protein [Methyloterricola oryzae]|uniref:SRPBCC family protein n=1 Tax=Methyloterricola oryzae TaxID=1495050 RepID=UPI001F3D0818|nr:SRPBCC family protein [Methyloterricola oryzae]